MDTAKVDPRLRGDDGSGVEIRAWNYLLPLPSREAKASPLPSFPRKRESIVDTAKVDPRLRGDDGSGATEAKGFAGMRAPFFTRP